MGTRIKKNPNLIYEIFCEIGIPPDSNKDPWITWKYPSNYKHDQILKSLPSFAYPCEFSNNAVQHFSFVLTNIDSQWTFGFCRHASHSSTCYVILSYLPWHEVFYKILNHVAELTNKEEAKKCKALPKFLENLYHAQIPEPGLQLHVLSNKNEDFVAVAPPNEKLPCIPDNRNVTEYFNAIDAQNMMTIFARQHIFIPVLPKHLSDYLSAPMPFLIGIPATTLSRMKMAEMGDVVFLDADENKIETPFADLDALPSDVLQSLRHDLKRPQELLGDAVARAFLRALVRLIGGYWNALKLRPTEKITFSADLFVQSRPSAMQPFLQKMLELQIFQQFIESRLKKLNAGEGVNDEFEFELAAHEDKASFRLRNQYRDWVSNMKKEGGAFFKNMKTKMKDTSRKAYKDIRTLVNEMNNHTVIEEEFPAGVRRRGSAPTALNAADKLGPKSIYKKESLSKTRGDLNSGCSSLVDRNLLVPMSPVRRSGSDSPQLTFQPVDLDLMGDLHEIIFRSCSLCSRTSEPQLIDLLASEHDTPCGPDCAASPAKTPSAVPDTPPPLLPRPPLSRGRPVSRSAIADASKPLVDLAGGSHDSAELQEIFSNVDPPRVPQRNLPFEHATSRSTNPFCQEAPFAEGPNVRNMVSHWQTTRGNTQYLSSSSEGLKTTPAQRPQVLSRTVSTPPGCSYVNPSSMLLLKSTAKVSTNPFVVADGKNNNGRTVANSNWENFQ